MSLRESFSRLSPIEELPDLEGTVAVTLLIPARASSHALEATVEAANDFLKRRFARDYEILVLPNTQASLPGDRSFEKATALAKRFDRLRVVAHDHPVGKGAGLRTGVLASRGRVILFTDADLPYELSFFDRALSRLATGDALVTGNRRLGNSQFELPVPLLRLAYRRHRLGILFNRFVRALLPIYTTDTQAGIKAMSRQFALRAFSLVTCPGFFFDLELFLIASGHGFRQSELPVALKLNTEKSTVRVLRESVLAAFWLARITWNSRLGFYGRPTAQPSILDLYPTRGAGTGLFLWLRWKLTPYAQMVRHLPSRGKILDLGCGHGLLSIAAALDSSDRELLGLDHDAGRIRMAREAGEAVGNVRFDQGGWESTPDAPYQGVAAIDVLHYLDAEEQDRLLSQCFQTLSPGGTLILREVDPEGGWVARWNRLYERLATAIGFTRSKRKTAHTFRTRTDWERALRTIGFSVHSERCSSALFADILYVCERPTHT